MGYSLWLEDKKGRICRSKVKRHNLGNMVCLDGTTEMEFNITYNYSPYFYEVEGFEDNGIREIYGLTGEQSLPLLEKLKKSIENKYYVNGAWLVTKRKKNVPYNKATGEKLTERQLVFEFHSIDLEWKEEEIEVNEGDITDYWQATAANACCAVSGLIQMARECPEGVWCGD